MPRLASMPLVFYIMLLSVVLKAGGFLKITKTAIVPDIIGLNKYKYCAHSALMDKRECTWQDTNYVLSYFGRKIGEARKSYYSYLKAGIDQGRRPELVGGGLIRSLGGWAEVKKMRLKGQARLKGDQRIVGKTIWFWRY
jgi:putative transposase